MNRIYEKDMIGLDETLTESQKKKLKKLNGSSDREEYKDPAEEDINEDLVAAFKNCIPDRVTFKHVIGWIETMLRKGESFKFPDYVIESLIKYATLFEEDEFIALMFNQNKRFSRNKITGFVVGQAMRIISQSNAEGSFSEVMEKLVKKYQEVNENDEDQGLGVLDYPDVASAIVRSYLKDNNLAEALLVRTM